MPQRFQKIYSILNNLQQNGTVEFSFEKLIKYTSSHATSYILNRVYIIITLKNYSETEKNK